MNYRNLNFILLQYFFYFCVNNTIFSGLKWYWCLVNIKWYHFFLWRWRRVERIWIIFI